MPSNEQVILDQILSQNRQEIADTLSESEFFELFSAEQILKDFDLSYDEIRSGIVAGGNDGGIDSIFLLINGELIVEDSDTSVYKKDITIDLVFIQSKRSAGFSEEGINKLYATTNELLDLSVNINLLSTVYNKLLLDIIKRFHDVYRALASKFPKLRIQYFYASRGMEVHQNVERKAEELKKLVIQKFSDAEVTVSFVGAPKMLELARRTPLTTFNLNLAETPISSDGAVAFICLVKLKDYSRFITDEGGA